MSSTNAFHVLFDKWSQKWPDEKEGDYLKEYNDHFTLTCGTCHQAKQTWIEAPWDKSKHFQFPCSCKCDEMREEKYKQSRVDKKLAERMKELQRRGVTDAAYLEMTFENDDKLFPVITEKCNKYVENWNEILKRNIGAVFLGDTDKGKTFMACCIGNALIAKQQRVLITNLSRLVRNRIDNPQQMWIDVQSPDLLILDDFGVEKSTQTAFNIIDDRYRCKKPMIITTNMKLEALKNPENIDQKRIFRRVLEMCGGLVLEFDTKRTRENVWQKKQDYIQEVLW